MCALTLTKTQWLSRRAVKRRCKEKSKYLKIIIIIIITKIKLNSNNNNDITYLNMSGKYSGQKRDDDNQQQMAHDGKMSGSHRRRVPIRGFGTNDSVQMPTTLLYNHCRPLLLVKVAHDRAKARRLKDTRIYVSLGAQSSLLLDVLLPLFCTRKKPT